jgi:hypothetical protein
MPIRHEWYDEMAPFGEAEFEELRKLLKKVRVFRCDTCGCEAPNHYDYCIIPRISMYGYNEEVM